MNKSWKTNSLRLLGVTSHAPWEAIANKHGAHPSKNRKLKRKRSIDFSETLHLMVKTELNKREELYNYRHKPKFADYSLLKKLYTTTKPQM